SPPACRATRPRRACAPQSTRSIHPKRCWHNRRPRAGGDRWRDSARLPAAPACAGATVYSVLPPKVRRRIILSLFDDRPPDRARAREPALELRAVAAADRLLKHGQILVEALQGREHR